MILRLGQLAIRLHTLATKMERRTGANWAVLELRAILEEVLEMRKAVE